MKILLIGHGYPPTRVGGVELYTKNIAENLSKHLSNDNIAVFVPGAYSNENDLKLSKDLVDGVNVYSFTGSAYRSEFRMGINPLMDIENTDALALLEKVLIEFDPDIVHVNQLLGIGAKAISLIKKYKKYLVVSLHDYWFICPRATLLNPKGEPCSCELRNDSYHCVYGNYRRGVKYINKLPYWIQSLIYTRNYRHLPQMRLWKDKDFELRNKILLGELLKADEILAVSSDVKNIFVSAGVPAGRVVVNHIGTPAASWYSQSKYSNSHKSKFSIGFIGGIFLYKGAMTLLTAFLSLPSKNNLTLTYYGSSERIFLEGMKNLSLGRNVNFNGSYSFYELPDILKGFDLIVVPPIWHDPAPQVVFEAMAMKVPVVGSRIGGIPDFIRDKFNGRLFSAGDSKELAAILKELIDKPELLVKYSSNIKAPKTLDIHIDELLQIYSKYLN